MQTYYKKKPITKKSNIKNRYNALEEESKEDQDERDTKRALVTETV